MKHLGLKGIHLTDSSISFQVFVFFFENQNRGWRRVGAVLFFWGGENLENLWEIKMFFWVGESVLFW